MESVNSKEDKTLFERASIQEARTLLSDAARTSAPTLIWNQSHETPLNITFGQLSEREKVIRLPLPDEPLPKAFSKAFEESVGQSFVFSVKVPKSNFFFKTEYLGKTDAALQFLYPAKLFKVQRRKARRFRVPADRFIKVAFQDPNLEVEKVNQKVYDLSREGLSFIVNYSPLARYRRGMRIDGLTLLLGRKKITANVQVLNSRILPSTLKGQELRVGVRFTEISAADSEMLGVFVEQEIQKELAKKL